MKSLIEKARKIHRNQKGFTLIELLVVLAILALIVGLVVPNFFGLIEGAEHVQIQGQHEKMREAVFLYFEDTSDWPTEWSGYNWESGSQLWSKNNIAGWQGPYLDRPIRQLNRWERHWGVREGIWLNVTGVTGYWTALVYEGVPASVMLAVDTAMDDGDLATGAVQRKHVVGNEELDLVIIIAEQ